MNASSAPITTEQRFILEWLSKEDWSPYGSCQGKDLDALIERGFARLATGAKTCSTGNTGVTVTEAGWALLKQLSEAAP